MIALYPVPQQVHINLEKELSNSKYTNLHSVESILNLYNLCIELFVVIDMTHRDFINSKDIQKSFNNNLQYKYADCHSKRLTSIQKKIDKIFYRYTHVRDILLQANCIQEPSRNVWSNGSKKFSKSYRPHIALDYNDCKMVSVDFKRIIKNFRPKEQLVATVADKNINNVPILLDLYRTRIDAEAYFDHLDTLKGSHYRVNTKDNKTEIIYYTPKIINDLKIRIIKINLGIHFFGESSTGRHYTSISNMPTSAVPYLTINGRQAIEIDAANCQPLLLNYYINHPNYKADCESGIFYDVMAKQMGITRTEFKIKSFAKIFFNFRRIRPIKDQELYNALEAVYPGFVKQLNALKFGSEKKWLLAKDEDKLWYKLQSLEAAIFVHLIPGYEFPTVTRHDSIICLPESVEEIKNKLISNFKKYGLNVQLKINQVS